MSKIYGYMRVSTQYQNDERQKVELLKEGIAVENIFLDKISGASFNRPEWKRLLKLLRKGDLLVIKSLDRLGRSYIQIGEEWRYLI